MKNFRYTDWRRDAVEGLKVAKQLGSQVFVLGYSTGGTMAADIALQYPNDIAGLFMFAPALDISTRTKLMVQTGVKIKFMPSESCTGDHLSPMCKAVGSLAAGSVKKAMPLLQEGLSWSPYAGVQVSHYIGAIYKDWKDKVQSIDESETEGKSTTLVKIYSLIRQPTFMALDEQDLTVSTYLSKAVFQNLASPKDLIVYSDADAIAHTNITKYSEDAYQGSKEFYNHFTEELESRMDQFISAVNPACK